ncbi:hypothetical protein IGI04_032879 [Brassica rapa subsp. trilocularis]|uniref:Uncharacterized protein n=1 Tax=Brassica rapa subsp. trilocularis TaxID=1813537 RepID=A0ABQ7L467_BRACM|nr:hypothetical protein IGI04_032879 [Brassica rapa subsp. trilocularis]
MDRVSRMVCWRQGHYRLFSNTGGVSASAAVAASIRTIVVRFADADTAAYRDRMFYRRQPQNAAFGRGVRRNFLRQRNEQELTLAAAVGTCGNQTNSPIIDYSLTLEGSENKLSPTVFLRR